MRVHFEVHGSTEADLLKEADKVLAAFSEGKRWNTHIEAHAAQSANDGSVLMWHADVYAEHEDIK